MVARPGDWIIAPFQCDSCWFFNVYGRKEDVSSWADTHNLRLIRRANLDMFWSRETSTVQGIRGHLTEIVRRSKVYGRKVPLEEVTPWEVGDREGMGIMMCMLEKSLDKGKNATYTQFDTCRKLRSAAASVYSSTSQSAALRYSLKNARGVMHLEEGDTQTVFMERTIAGMKARMPQVSKRNLPFTSEMINFILERLEEEWFKENLEDGSRRIALMTAAYLCVTYGYSLRGNEGLWVDTDKLCENIQVGKRDQRCPHVIVPLLGRFKGEEGDRMHVIPLVNETRSGIRIRIWIERLVRLLKQERKSNCPAFCDEDGYLLRATDLEGVIHPILKEMQNAPEHLDVIPRSLDVKLWYRLARSCRRGAENRALDQGVNPKVIDFVHRWSMFEKNKGRLPGFDMMQHYAAGNKTRYLQLQFSECL